MAARAPVASSNLADNELLCMGIRDPRVDAYIAKSADFAKPILTHIRETIHAAVPEVEESIKWSMPAFEHHGPLMNMAAFKAHATVGFWKGQLVVGRGPGGDAMGHLGRITSVKDLPPKKELVALIRKAAKLNEDGVKVEKKKTPRPTLPVPPELTAALAKNKKAQAAFTAFPPSHQREYNEWIGEAKREETKAARVKQAVEWIAEGKPRNWKYQN